MMQDHLEAVHRLALYRKAPIFREYVDYWYPLKVQYKTEGNALYTRMVKLYLNSLYGKFGQRRFVEHSEELVDHPEITREECYDTSTGEHWIEYSLFNVFVRQFGKVDTAYTFTAIAAHVTDYARMKLWKIIKLVGRERVLYCDTDSVVLREADILALSPLRHPTTLGALSVGKRTNTLTINGAKDYVTDDGRTVKGVPADAIQIGEHTYLYDQFLRSRTLQRLGCSEGGEVRQVIKTVIPAYDKGQVLPDGRILPWRLGA